jgi:hypothetical protein
MPTRLPGADGANFADTLLEAHAADVGRVALSWNDVHEALGELFSEIIALDGRSVALAVWQTIPSDRGKRAVLYSASLIALGEESKFTQEIKWMVTGQVG